MPIHLRRHSRRITALRRHSHEDFKRPNFNVTPPEGNAKINGLFYYRANEDIIRRNGPMSSLPLQSQSPAAQKTNSTSVQKPSNSKPLKLPQEFNLIVSSSTGLPQEMIVLCSQSLNVLINNLDSFSHLQRTEWTVFSHAFWVI